MLKSDLFSLSHSQETLRPIPGNAGLILYEQTSPSVIKLNWSPLLSQQT